MSLRETYLSNVSSMKTQYPNAVFIDVTRRNGHVLSPSWKMLNAYKNGQIDWTGYIQRFRAEMLDQGCVDEMLRIGELAMVKDVFLVCFEKKGNCHRFLLIDMINALMLDRKGMAEVD